MVKCRKGLPGSFIIGGLFIGGKKGEREEKNYLMWSVKAVAGCHHKFTSVVQIH